MFESLTERLSGVFRAFAGKRLSGENIQEALREVRLALLEADVNYKVVKDFVDRVGEACLGQEVSKGLNPAQQVVKIVHNELVALLGGEHSDLDLRGRQPGIIMMVGLQGSGKTTSAGKIAHLLRKGKMRPYLVPADVYRPAAIEQLRALARQLDMPCFASSADMRPVDICRQAVVDAREQQATVLLLDTAGRLHVDEALMQELADIKSAVEPQEILFVADAMTGQDAVTVAQSFNDRIGITGVVLTKMDGDARGGAALSIKAVTGAPVKYVGMGEKLSDLEVFHPDRVAGRILGMGDMLSLIEKAQTTTTQEEAEELARKMQKAQFTLEDFRIQMRRVKQMGSLESILKMIPGMGALRDQLSQAGPPEKELERTEAIMNSMTMQERNNPDILNGSRRARIAKGSGTTVQDVNKLLRGFEQMRRMMKGMMSGNASGSGRMPRGMPGMGGMPGMPDVYGMGGMPGMPGSGGGRASAAKTKKKREKQKHKQKRKKKK